MAKKKSRIGFDPLAWMKDTSRESRVASRESREGSLHPTPHSALRTAHSQAAQHSALSTQHAPALIVLGESLTIEDVRTKHAEWKAPLSGGGEIELDATALQKVDTAALQLLVALVREAEARRATVRWRNPSAALRQGAERLGLKTILRLP